MTKPGIYTHKKGGKYFVCYTATNATNGDKNGNVVVVYMSLETGKYFVRDEVEFNEPGRFTLQEGV